MAAADEVADELHALVRDKVHTSAIAEHFGARSRRSTAEALLLILRRTAGVTVKKVNVWKKKLNISTYDHFDDDDA
jgi:hypothetical protein